MIVKDETTVAKYVTINSSVTYETLKPFLNQAERKEIKSLIGVAQVTVFDINTAPADPIVNEAYELCQEAICYFAMYRALPHISVQITESGIFAASNQDAQQITDKQYKELQRNFKRQGHEALDEMLKVMEANISKFTEWTADASYTSFKNLLVNTTNTFNNYYNIFESRQTFIALKPEILIVESQFIEAAVQPELLAALKATQTVDERKNVKKLLQQAIVAFTISKVVENGLFVLSAEGIHVRFDVLPYEQVHSNISLKINDFLVHTRTNKVSEGEQYLKKAMAIITANTDKFTEYVAPVDAVAKQTVYSTPGITLC